MSTSTTLTEKTAGAVTKMRADLLSGTYFGRGAISARSAYGYRPPLTSREWSHAMKTVAAIANGSDPLAQVATQILGSVNLYGTRPEAMAQIYEAAAVAIRREYDDVIGRSGPEGGRWSSHHRAFNLRECVLLALWLNEATSKMQDGIPGVGWVMQLIIDEERISVPVMR